MCLWRALYQVTIVAIAGMAALVFFRVLVGVLTHMANVLLDMLFYFSGSISELQAFINAKRFDSPYIANIKRNREEYRRLQNKRTKNYANIFTISGFCAKRGGS